MSLASPSSASSSTFSARHEDKETPLREQQINLGTTGQAAHRAVAITSQDTIIETADGHRLPGVPVSEAKKLNALQHQETGSPPPQGPLRMRVPDISSPDILNPLKSVFSPNASQKHLIENGETRQEREGEANIEKAPAFTDPLFPPLPVYGPPSLLRRFQVFTFRATSGILSLCFLSVVVMGSIAESIPVVAVRLWKKARGKHPDEERPFFAVEQERAQKRKEDELEWKKKRRRPDAENDVEAGDESRIEGGKDKLVCDVGYYARRVGLDVEYFKVETEDGFLLSLEHVFDPADPPYYPSTDSESMPKAVAGGQRSNGQPGRRKYPVLLMHGLLQSSGAFCVNDDDSLAFYLCKCGYDVWLGNNRCGFKPEHTVLKYSDPRMWAWNIRQMGILDLPAFITHILTVTSFPKLGLVAHSQGTTQTFVALAKQQRPEIGEKLSVFCALAPAVYAGDLINKFYFKFMRVITPAMFRIAFGIHAFIPFMLTMHSIVPANLYGKLGYQVFWFLFGWSDVRWDRGLRNRFFRFAPVYVSAETMRWWLGKECFARHRCILSTKQEEARREEESRERRTQTQEEQEHTIHDDPAHDEDGQRGREGRKARRRKGKRLPSDVKDEGAWYDERFPPLALWVCDDDKLVDGHRLLRRLDEGREPCVELVHRKILDGFHHLDVLWAVDAREQVFEEVAGVLWKTAEATEGVVEPRGAPSGLA